MFLSPLTICSTAMFLQMYLPLLQVAQISTLGLQVPQMLWPFLQLKIWAGVAIGSRQTGQAGISWDKEDGLF